MFWGDDHNESSWMGVFRHLCRMAFATVPALKDEQLIVCGANIPVYQLSNKLSNWSIRVYRGKALMGGQVATCGFLLVVSCRRT